MVKAKINPIVKLLNGYPNEFKKSVRARGVDNKGKPISIDRKIYIVRAQNRASAQKEIEDALIKVQIYNYRKKEPSLSGSTEVTIIDDPEEKNCQYVLVFKPASGGMQETTLNSTITELAPAVAFTQNISFKGWEDLYNQIKATDPKKLTVYVNEIGRAHV